MKSIIASLITMTIAGSVWAGSENLTIHDLNKTLELCKSMKDFKGWCPDAAKACAGEKTYEDKKACLEKQSK